MIEKGQGFMQLEVPRLFRIWRFQVADKQFNIRSSGVRVPSPLDQIDVRFRGTLRLDVDDEFYLDAIEEGESELPQHRRYTLLNRPGGKTFILKLSGETVGRVDALSLSVVMLTLPPIDSRL
jgi:hypothetical protein